MGEGEWRENHEEETPRQGNSCGTDSGSLLEVGLGDQVSRVGDSP